MIVSDERAASMRRHPAGKGRTMTDNEAENVIPLFREDRPVPVEDAPSPTKRQMLAALLASAGDFGITVKHLELVTGWEHGSASGALSNAHRDGRVARLSDDYKQDGLTVYVDPRFVGDRQTVPYRLNQQGLVDLMAAALRRQYRGCNHKRINPTCKQCEIEDLLDRYDRLKKGGSNS
jgi:hypothetical protein